MLIEQAANNLQSAPQHVHVTHLARLDMTEHSAISERSTGLHRYVTITPPASSQDGDSKLWITQRGQLAGGSRAQSRRYGLAGFVRWMASIAFRIGISVMGHDGRS